MTSRFRLENSAATRHGLRPCDASKPYNVARCPLDVGCSAGVASAVLRCEMPRVALRQASATRVTTIHDHAQPDMNNSLKMKKVLGFHALYFHGPANSLKKLLQNISHCQARLVAMNVGQPRSSSKAIHTISGLTHEIRRHIRK